MENPWRYPREKSRGVRNTLITHYHNLTERLALTVSGDLIFLLNLSYYPDDDTIAEIINEIISLLPEDSWDRKIYWLHHTKIKRIVEKLVKLDYLIEQRYWGFEIIRLKKKN